VIAIRIADISVAIDWYSAAEVPRQFPQLLSFLAEELKDLREHFRSAALERW